MQYRKIQRSPFWNCEIRLSLEPQKCAVLSVCESLDPRVSIYDFDCLRDAWHFIFVLCIRIHTVWVSTWVEFKLYPFGLKEINLDFECLIEPCDYIYAWNGNIKSRHHFSSILEVPSVYGGNPPTQKKIQRAYNVLRNT